MENIVKIIYDITDLTVKLDEVESAFEDVKRKYIQINQQKNDLHAERKKLLDELLRLCE